jgi:hypothetical protein
MPLPKQLSADNGELLQVIKTSIRPTGTTACRSDSSALQQLSTVLDVTKYSRNFPISSVPGLGCR